MPGIVLGFAETVQIYVYVDTEQDCVAGETGSNEVSLCPCWWGLVGWSIIPYTKRLGVDSWSGHIPRLWVQSPVGAPMAGNHLMFLSHVSYSLSGSCDKNNLKRENYFRHCDENAPSGSVILAEI